MFTLTCVCICSLFFYCDSAKILGVSSSPMYSHQTFFRPIWIELANRGHELTVITASPMNDPSLKIKEINISFIYDIWNEKYHTTKLMKKHGKNYFSIFQDTKKGFAEVISKQLEDPEVKKVLNGEYGSFDLVILEFLHPVIFPIAYKLKCPYIGVTTTDLSFGYHKLFGNPIHPILYPDFLFPFHGQLSLGERLLSTLYTVMLYLDDFYNDCSVENKIVRKHFGEDTPILDEIAANVSMIFMNVNPVLNTRPLGPAFIPIGGGIQLKPSTPLPKDLQEFLDGSAEGVIYFSLGTNVKSNNIDKKLVDIFIKTFGNLDLKILWKFDAKIPNIPKNVKIVNWVPQQDVLRHSNVKLFITQGGIHSIEEAIFFEKPILGIPFLLDQEQNIKKVVCRGFATLLYKHTLTVPILKKSILDLVQNQTYKEKVIEISRLSKDQPMSGLEKAMWWIEYVLRHKGAKHFRNPIFDIPLYQYYMLDVIAIFASVLLIIILVLILLIILLRRILQNYFGRSQNLKKKNT